MRTKNLIFSVIALLFFSSMALAQVRGTVVDEFGPIPGVNISVVGSEQSTVTDDDGNFMIMANIGDQLMIVNPLTLAEKNIMVTKLNLGKLSIKDAVVTLDEVVISGYVQSTASQVSSAVSTISAEELAEMTPSTSVDNMLQGKAAGVQVTSKNGKPGQTAVVRIRGVGSIAGGGPSAPLYVVDGTFMAESDLAAINPNDIDNVTILKDAAAAALYGSRAANGVVVISTKRGASKDGNAVFTYSSRFGWGEKTKDPFKMMNAAQKLEYERQLFELGVPGASYRTGEERNKLASLDHDWQKTLLRKSHVESHSFSVSGSSEKVNYFTSVGYDQNTGIIDGIDGFERITGRFNMDAKANSWFNVGASLGGAYETSDESRDRHNVQNPFVAMYDYNPYEPLYAVNALGQTILDDSGVPVWNKTHLGFSISEALRKNPEKTKHFRLFGNVYGKVNFTEHLNFTSRVSANFDNYLRESYVMPGSILDSYVGDPFARGSKTDEGSYDFKYTWYNGLNYDFSLWDNHNLNLLAFTEWNAENYYSYRLSSKGYSSQIFDTQNNGTVPTATETNRTKYQLMSYATNLSYDYDQRYLINASFRRDGSSRFGVNDKWGNFWALSLGWNIAKESFLLDNKNINDLKIRASYGSRGSDRFSGLRASLANVVSQNLIYSNNYGTSGALTQSYLIGNKDLKWESVYSTNIGLELSVFDRRFRTVVDLFKDERKNFLFEKEYAHEAGGKSRYINAGSLENSGIELEVSLDAIRTIDFTWNLYTNITWVKALVKDLNGLKEVIPSSYTRHVVGMAPFTYFLPRYVGVDPATGDALYYTENGSVTNNFNDAERVLLEGKSPNPDFYGGFGTRFNYKGFDVSTNFNFQSGNYILNFMASNMLSDGDRIRDNQRLDAFNYWREPGDVNVLPAPGRDTNQVSDRFLQDGSYLRWRSISLGYSFNQRWFEKIPLNKLRVYATAQNLATWTSYEGDPEVAVGSGEAQTTDFVPGEFALYSYPTQKTFLIGIEVSF